MSTTSTTSWAHIASPQRFLKGIFHTKELFSSGWNDKFMQEHYHAFHAFATTLQVSGI